MQYRILGETDLNVSVISMGCWAIGDERFWGNQDEDQAIAALRTAFDVGINFFDTAEVYGRSEELIGRALGDIRDKVIIATKVSKNHLKPEDVVTSCEASLKRLRTDYIDVYYIHWRDWTIPIQDTLGALERLKQAGKIRVIGFSNFGTRDLTEALQYGRAEVDQLPYNLLWRGIELEIQNACVKNRVSIACYSPLLAGLLTGKFRTADDMPAVRARSRHFAPSRNLAEHGEPGAERETFETIDKIRAICDQAGTSMPQVALAWLLKQKGIATVIAGARSPEQVRANAKASEIQVSEQTAEALTQVTEPLKLRFGPNVDLLKSESRIR